LVQFTDGRRVPGAQFYRTQFYPVQNEGAAPYLY
jgi:hypothetical protein